MKQALAPRVLAAPLFLALFAAPAIMQEGLVSLWKPWGFPLLTAAGVFALLSLVVCGAWALGAAVRAGGERESLDGGDSAEDGAEAAAGEAGPATMAAEGAVEADEEADDEIDDGPDLVLSEALSELEPENFMDLVRALQEMGRHGEALEVLARASEMQQGEYAEQIARALRRMRRQLGEEPVSAA